MNDARKTRWHVIVDLLICTIAAVAGVSVWVAGVGVNVAGVYTRHTCYNHTLTSANRYHNSSNYVQPGSNQRSQSKTDSFNVIARKDLAQTQVLLSENKSKSLHSKMVKKPSWFFWRNKQLELRRHLTKPTSFTKGFDSSGLSHQVDSNQSRVTTDQSTTGPTHISRKDGQRAKRKAGGQVATFSQRRRRRQSEGVAGYEMSRRTRQTQSGMVRGLLLAPAGSSGGRVEAYLGVQYASLLGSQLRFMPPTSPADTWHGVREAHTFAPVCPQPRPDLRRLETSVPTGYLHHLHHLMTFTELQTEDCLYLNIYVPLTPGGDVNETALLPVAVFILTENYEMGTANMYDGSILAAYGHIVIVTVNFRLGPLGFLSTGDDSASGNYALMDMVAALHWLQENIAAFSGQPKEVTLVGQGYGSALVHLLLVSPITIGKGLFKRAIVQSGSAYASWAMVKQPLVSAKQLASQVNCSSQDTVSMIGCLRGISFEALTDVHVTSYKYLSAWGPVIDGRSVVQQSVHAATQLALASMHHVSLLLGHMRDEGLLHLTQSQLERGVRTNTLRRVVNTYVRNTYLYKRQTLLDVLLHHYTDWQRPEDSQTSRDALMNLLGDGQWTAPLVHLAQRASYAAITTFVYVFHAPARTPGYPAWATGVRGDDVTYLMGQPLRAPQGDSSMYSDSDKRLSECLMTYWSNFIVSGNPNWPGRAARNEDSGVLWPLYDSHEQLYLNIGTRATVRSHYRSSHMSLWLDLLPRLHRSDDLPPRYHLLADYTRFDAFDEGTRPLDLLALLPPSPPPLNTSMLAVSVSSPLTSDKATTARNRAADDLLQRYGQGIVDQGTANHVKQKDYTPTVLNFISGIGGSLLVVNVALLLYVCHQRHRLKRLTSQQQFAFHMHRTLLPHMTVKKSRTHNGRTTESDRLRSEHCNSPKNVTTGSSQAQCAEQHIAAPKTHETLVSSEVCTARREAAELLSASSFVSSRKLAQWTDVWYEDGAMVAPARTSHLSHNSPHIPSTTV